MQLLDCFPAPRGRRTLITLAACTLLAAGSAQAQTAEGAASERAALQELRATTNALIEALVEQGLLPRAKADALLAQARAAGSAAREPQWGAAAGASVGADGKPVVRVPYISETARAQIKEEIRQEVLATARDERWADPKLLPEWVKGITIAGDVRVRAESDMMENENTPAEAFRAQLATPAWAPDLTNTQNTRNRLTLRARIGADAVISDEVSAGVRIATGAATSSPTSESLTLGNYSNRLAIGIDRAWLRWQPWRWLRMTGGRMGVPFEGSDLMWPDDLGLDGLALRAGHELVDGLDAFGTVGSFQLDEWANSGNDKWLHGAQLGLRWAPSERWEFKTAFGAFGFDGVAGVRENTLPPTGVNAGVQPYYTSAYPANVRQKGNTLINLNAPTVVGSPVWGLASRFKPLHAHLAVASKHLSPFTIGAAFDVVRNTGWDMDDIMARAGSNTVQSLAEKTLGYQAKLSLTCGSGRAKGDWSAFAAWRHFERDAWLDAYTDTTWHLGGTNYKGFSVGANYAVDKRSLISLRYTSTRNLDDGYRFLMVPGDPTSLAGNMSSAPLRFHVLQIDATVQF